MKRLPPAIQQDQRYLRFKIHSEDPKQLGETVKAIWNTALNFMGTRDSGKADIRIIGNKFDEKEQQGIIRISKFMVDDLRAALTLIESIGNEKAFLEVKEVSGTMNT